MSESVIGNPDEMRQFANHLTKFAMDLRTMDVETRSKMNHLKQTWRDRKGQEFDERYLDTIKFFPALLETLDSYSAYLKESAGQLDEYLKKRI